MAWHFRVLVVANVTADSPELIDALTARAAQDLCSFTLVVPAPVAGSAGNEAAAARLDTAIARMHEAGLEADGIVGDHDVIAAVHDAWDPGRYDEIVVCTLPTGTSRWLQVDLPHRIAKLTDAQVRHVIAQPPRPQSPARQRQRAEPPHLGLLTPLSAVTGKRPPRA